MAQMSSMSVVPRSSTSGTFNEKKCDQRINRTTRSRDRVTCRVHLNHHGTRSKATSD
jgi:hypothetical protein